MNKTKCITFHPVVREALPNHIKAKMKAARDKARLEVGTVTTIVAMMIIVLVIEIVSI